MPILDPFSLGKGSHTADYRPFPFCDFINLANEANYFRHLVSSLGMMLAVPPLQVEQSAVTVPLVSVGVEVAELL